MGWCVCPLQHNHTLQTLHVGHNQIGADGCKAIAQALQVLSALLCWRYQVSHSLLRSAQSNTSLTELTGVDSPELKSLLEVRLHSTAHSPPALCFLLAAHLCLFVAGQCLTRSAGASICDGEAADAGRSQVRRRPGSGRAAEPAASGSTAQQPPVPESAGVSVAVGAMHDPARVGVGVSTRNCG